MSHVSSSCKWSMAEREKILATGSLDEKKEAFKDDEELMRETTKFVSEVIETATTQATKRQVHSTVNVARLLNLSVKYVQLLFVDHSVCNVSVR